MEMVGIEIFVARSTGSMVMVYYGRNFRKKWYLKIKPKICFVISLILELATLALK